MYLEIWKIILLAIAVWINGAFAGMAIIRGVERIGADQTVRPPRPPRIRKGS